MSLLAVENLQTHFRTPDGINRAVDGVSFHVEAGETVAIVGESGCGKSVTANSILRLIPEPPGKIAGRILFEGRDLLAFSDREMRKIRGNDISMIFQEPMTSLNPVLTIGRQLGETVRLHQGLDRKAAEERSIEMLRLVGIPEPARRIRNYPHQLSGGMRQRVMIAMALACSPKLLIADEPTTALDVTIQAQILDLMRDLKHRVGAAIILITHDLGVVAEVASRVIVMYAGRKVEEAPVAELFRAPKHPYTQGLIGAVPKLGSSLGGHRTRLAEIPGVVPNLKQRIEGCVFAGRCPHATELCRQVRAGAGAEGPGPRRRLPLFAPRGGGGMNAAAPLLEVNDLVKHFPLKGRAVVRAVDGVSFEVRRGETLSLVGESGCGKSTVGRAILRLLQPTAGQVVLDGQRIDQAVGRHAAAAQAPHAGRLPGPVLEPEPADAGAGHPGRADPQFRARPLGGRDRRARREAPRYGPAAARCRLALSRTNSRAGSASASASPVRSRPSPTSSSATRRCRRSMSRSRRRS
jgi:peptide/nickel transport system ATP-binding protein